MTRACQHIALSRGPCLFRVSLPVLNKTSVPPSPHDRYEVACGWPCTWPAPIFVAAILTQKRRQNERDLNPRVQVRLS